MNILKPAGLLKTFGAVSFALFMLSAVAVAGEIGTVYELGVNGLACPFCAYGVEKEFNAMKGVEKVDIDLERGVIIVTMTGGAVLDEATAQQAVENSGFSLRGFEAIGRP